MKNYRMIRKLLNPLSCCLLISVGMLTSTLQAQTQTDEKIRLMSDALAARDVGDLQRARENLLRLLELNPNDPALQRLLENVELNMRQPEPAVAQPGPDGVPADAPRDLSAEEARRFSQAVEEATAFQDAARRLQAQGNHADAIDALERARTTLPLTAATERRYRDIERAIGEAHLAHARQQLEAGDLEGARGALNRYAEVGEETRRTERLARRIEGEIRDPARLPIEEVSPNFRTEQEQIRQLLRAGRAQYLNGDIYGAEQSFRQAEAMDVYNAEAKAMLTRIAEDKRARNHLDREKTRTQMLEEIGSAWQRPQIYVERAAPPPDTIERPELEQRMESIIIPSVNFTGVEFARAINTLSTISQEYDPTGRGVNIVARDPEGIARPVHINVRDLNLRRILDLIVDDAGFQYEIEQDVVVVRPGARRRPDLETENFPVSPATVSRLIGRGGAPQPGAAQQQPAMDDPFAAPTQPAATPQAAPAGGESQQIRQFLTQAAGVDFNVQGSSLIYDGSDIWITQTPRNLERIRNVFRRLSDVRQVEIEARFLEVSEGSLDEMGFNWALQSPGGTTRYATSNRDLAGAFAGSGVTRSTRFVGPGIPGGSIEFPVAPPSIPGTAGLGAGALPIAVIENASFNDFSVSATLRMLQQRTGADLLSAPKITVLSGHQATINVAQEIRYPDSYGDTQSEVGRGGTGDAGSAGVTITPGTPQDFQMRRVGVELTVTPTVEQDNSVTLDLNPRVTEFEGFVEYGGTAVAISGGLVSSVPSGFYQPIFATREVNTRVNIWDGATVVMGGLTREEVRRVSDKTPILGDLPILGRFFRSEGEGSQKRNLLIFVTANLVSPGGSPMRQQLRTVEPGALYQNPTIVMPSGAVAREKVID
jgi:general secretion pathway protein D